MADFSFAKNSSIKKSRLTIKAPMDEAVDLTFHTNGAQGGDSSYGGYAKLDLLHRGVNSEVNVLQCGPNKSHKLVSFKVEGDLELSEFILGLIRLGRNLEETYATELSRSQ